MILVSKHMVPKGYIGMAVFPFVFIKHSGLKADTQFLNHERIHLRQQMELLVIPFFVWYGMEFLFRYVQYGSKKLAYRNISFEREAYAQEQTLDYLKRRFFWSFMYYL